MVQPAAPLPHKVALCVITFRRPQGLATLLDCYRRLRLPDGDVEIVVVVVDNDETGPAAAVVDEHRGSLPFPVVFGVESRRGIPYARNRAVQLARAAGADFVAFIDDDELPDPGWLVELLRVQAETGADVVTGPVDPSFEVQPPSWVVKGGFFDRPRFRDGEEIEWATTSSVLVSMPVFGGDHPFDETRPLEGGSDTRLFWEARQHGFRIFWADHARVVETIPATRLSKEWVLRREFRRGTTMGLCTRDLEPFRRKVRRFATAGFRIAEGTGMFLVGLVRGPVARLRGVHRIRLGVGIWAGLLGVRYREYTVVHGR